MNQAISLSIIIPVYNEEGYIGACLDAIASQSEPPDEVIVVDNNSTDRTVEIAKKYSFVRVLTEPKQGVVYARDTGFDAAKSDVIGRIDADTRLPKDWVHHVKATFTHHKTQAATGPVCYYDMPLPGSNYDIDHLVRKHLYRGAPHVPFLFGSNMAIRSRAWHQIRSNVCRSKDMHEDLDIAVHMMQAKLHIHYDKQLLASTSSRRYDDSPKSFAHYMGVYVNTYRKHGIKSIVPNIATGLYWIGYVSLYPLRRAYDPSTGKRSLQHLLKGNIARKHPM